MTTITGGTTASMDSFDMTLGRGAIWRYVIDGSSGTNMRVGIIQAVWDQVSDGGIEYIPDEHSDDIGDTSAVSFAVDKSGTTVRLRATSTGGTFNFYGVRSMIGVFY